MSDMPHALPLRSRPLTAIDRDPPKTVVPHNPEGWGAWDGAIAGRISQYSTAQVTSTYAVSVLSNCDRPERRVFVPRTPIRNSISEHRTSPFLDSSSEITLACMLLSNGHGNISFRLISLPCMLYVLPVSYSTIRRSRSRSLHQIRHRCSSPPSNPSMDSRVTRSEERRHTHPSSTPL
jgi:hypothetical protein